MTYNTQKCTDCGGLPGIHPEYRCPACHVKYAAVSDTDNTQGLDEILERLRLWYATDNPKALRSLNDLEAKQAILQWVNDTVVQSPQDIEDMEHQYPVEKQVRHEVSAEQLNILKQHGFKQEGE